MRFHKFWSLAFYVLRVHAISLLLYMRILSESSIMQGFQLFLNMLERWNYEIGLLVKIQSASTLHG